MKSFFPLVAAIGLALTSLPMIFVIPRTLLLLPNLGEMALPTALSCWVSQRVGWTTASLLVMAIALLLGFRQFVGWVCALALCAALDLVFLGLLLPLTDNLRGGFIDSSFFRLPPIVLIIVAVLLNQALFVSLLVKRRQFAR